MLKLTLSLLLILSINVFSQVSLQWARQYNGTGNGDDAAYSIVLDTAGNVYIAGSVMNPSLNRDYIVIKYNSLGIQQWAVNYNGPGDGDDVPTKIFYKNGYIYVTGYSAGSGTGIDCATIKYNLSGTPQWTARYNNPANTSDFGYFLSVDGSGNVYVTGKSGTGINHDFLVIKYNSSGDTTFTRRWDYSNENREDYGSCLAVDNFGNIYMAGTGHAGTNGDQGVLYRLSPVGVIQWGVNFGGTLENDYCNYVVLDATGNVYVTGRMDIIGGNHNITTRKYNSAGTQLWAWRSPYSGSGNVCAIDNSGNVVTSGYKGYPGFTNVDFIIAKHNTNGDTLWSNVYNGTGNGNDYSNSLSIDAGDSIYICGYSPGATTGMDFATLKCSPSGSQQWIQRYNFSGTVNDYGNAIGLDNLGNVYVTGYSGADITTIRYSQYLPAPPVLYSPANNSTLQPVNINLLWLRSPLAVNYRIQLSTDSLFNTLIVNDSLLTDTVKAVSGLNYLTYYWWKVNAKNSAGTSLYSPVWKFRTADPVGIQPSGSEIPESFKLYSNYPNPFNPVTKIKFDIPVVSFTRLSIFDILGKEISVQVNHQLQPGKYEVVWDATDLPSGIYFYKITTGVFNETGKMLFIK